MMMLRCILSSIVAFSVLLGAIFLAPTVKAELPSSITPIYDVDLPSNISSFYNRAVSDYCSSHHISNELGNFLSFVTVYSDGSFNVYFAKTDTSSSSQSIRFERDPGIGSYLSGRCFYSGFIDGVAYYPSNGQLLSYDSSEFFRLGNVSTGSFYCNFTTVSSSSFNFTLNFIRDSFGENTPERYGSVDSLSNANLLAGLYDITFTPTVSFPADFPLIGKSLKVAPVAVRDDTGYNLISLQVPQLGAYADVIVFGEYHFVPSKSNSETYFNGLKFSFGSDPLNENDEEYDGTITPSMFSCVVDGHSLKPKGMTVNSLSFFYNTKLQKYSNREFTIFDYSSTDSNIYPSVRFMGIGSINGMSAGSVCYNCDFSGLVSPDNPQTIAEEGRKKTEDTVDELGYVPVDLSYPDPSEGFTFDDPQTPDFSALGNIFSFMFNNRIIRAMLEMCLVVGLAGYVMYGKKGD